MQHVLKSPIQVMYECKTHYCCKTFLLKTILRHEWISHSLFLVKTCITCLYSVLESSLGNGLFYVFHFSGHIWRKSQDMTLMLLYVTTPLFKVYFFHKNLTFKAYLSSSLFFLIKFTFTLITFYWWLCLWNLNYIYELFHI